MFKKWPKIYRCENETFTITEKIDGTNACVVILPDKRFKDGLKIFAQSRTRIITPQDDNYGFGAFVEANREDLKQLGVGYHYGEWWGQGINRNYGLKERRFSLFRQDYKDLPNCCNKVPNLGVWDFDNLPFMAKTIKDSLSIFGSKAVEDFMNPEGIIIQSNLYPACRWKYIINK